jgi:hypothetical protein
MEGRTMSDRQILANAVREITDRSSKNTFEDYNEEQRAIEAFVALIESGVQVSHSDVRDEFEQHGWTCKAVQTAENMFDYIQRAFEISKGGVNASDSIERWRN